MSARAIATLAPRPSASRSLRGDRILARRRRPLRASSSSAASSSDDSAALALLERLLQSYERDDALTFAALVRERREDLTLSFFDAAQREIDALERGGEVARARALDEACAAVAARAEYTLDEIIADASMALPGSSGDLFEAVTSETGLTAAQDEEVRRRWRAVTSALATTGEANAVKQLALNAFSRRNAVSEIAGRVQVGMKEFEALKSVAPERRIAEVLLTIPRGAERAAAVEDALTPPAEGEDVEGDEENEVVFTTAPRLLNALEGMARELRRAGEDASEVDELCQIVEAKCDY